jgi:intracellular sulfur oxidation DsrE/DsrF family protein
MNFEFAGFAFGMALLTIGGAAAQTPAVGMPDEPAFVEHRLAIQLSDDSEGKQAQTLNAAFNVLKAYGPDKVAIEIVTFGPGVELLREGNPIEVRISSLIAQGVRFDVCMNTLETIERTTGKAFPLNPHAQKVSAGVVQLMTLAEHGYMVIRP